jgi:hypothetical protein
MKPETVKLGFLAAATGYDRSALVVNLQHQLGGLASGIAEEVLEHPGDVRHQVDGIVPDDHEPRLVGSRLFGRNLALDPLWSGDRFHLTMLPRRELTSDRAF